MPHRTFFTNVGFAAYRSVFLLWILVDVLVQILLEAFFALFRALDEDEAAWPLAVVLFLVVGFLIGGATAWAIPRKLLEPGPFLGVSLGVVPVVLGAFMEFWGSLLEGRGRRTSHLATWYGGASMGFGLAAGRLTVLQLATAPSA